MVDTRLFYLLDVGDSLEDSGGVGVVAPHGLLVVEEDPLLPGPEHVHPAQQRAVTRQVPLLRGPEDVPPHVQPQEAQQAQPPLLRPEECLLCVQVKWPGEEWLKLLGAELLVKHRHQRHARPAVRWVGCWRSQSRGCEVTY